MENSILVHDLSDGDLLTHPSMLPVDQGVHEIWPKTLPVNGQSILANGRRKGVVPAGGRTIAQTKRTDQNGLPMSLIHAIADALQHNLSIKVKSYEPAISQTEIVAAKAAFDPTFIGETQYQHLDQPTPFPQTLGSFSQIGINSEDQVNTQLGVKKLLSTGGTVQFNSSNNYQDFHSSAGLPPDINPSHTADLSLQLKQPLLRGFGVFVNRAEIYIAQRNQGIAVSVFRSQVIKTIAHVETTYLQLSEATRDLDFERQLLSQSRRTLRRLQSRRKMDVDSVQINQALAAVDLARFDVAAAEKRTADYSQALKALLNDPRVPVGPGPIIFPSNRPTPVPLAFDLNQEIAVGLAQRGVMQRDRLQLEKAGIRRRVAENALLPKADLIAATDSSGLSANGGLPGGFNRAISDPHFGFSAGLEVEIPIGNRHARAELARRRLIRRQLMTQMLDDAQNIARDIADDLVNLTQDWRQIRMAHARKESAFAVLRGLRVQERAGQVLNPTFLQLELNAQRDLAQARIADVQARTNYCADMVRFERDKGTLLQFDRVAVTPQ